MLRQLRLRQKNGSLIDSIQVYQAKYIVYYVKYTFTHSLIRTSSFVSYLKAWAWAYSSKNKAFLYVHDQHQLVYIRK